jgi:serine/threonine protein phosphatase PrpC
MLDGIFEPDRVEIDVAGGRAVAYTARQPGKDTGNEDSVAIIPYGPGAAVLVVADGAGGLPAGKRASLTAVATLAASLQTAMDKTMLLRTAILNGIEAANEADQIGDSEAMIVGQRGLMKLQTTAHSPTGFAVEAGFLDEREALHHEERHLVSNFLGTIDMRIDVGAAVRLDPRDTVFVASDGLMDNVHVEEIIECIRKGPLLDAAMCAVELAGRRMRICEEGEPSKPDDLSMILFRKPHRGAT